MISVLCVQYKRAKRDIDASTFKEILKFKFSFMITIYIIYNNIDLVTRVSLYAVVDSVRKKTLSPEHRRQKLQFITFVK